MSHIGFIHIERLSSICYGSGSAHVVVLFVTNQSLTDGQSVVFVYKTDEFKMSCVLLLFIQFVTI